MGMFGKVAINRCSADTVYTDAVAKRSATNVIGNYSPYTLYTYANMGNLFYNGRPLPYVPSVDNATIHRSRRQSYRSYRSDFSTLSNCIQRQQNITGLKVWLDGKTLAGAAGATVGAWGDSSGNGIDCKSKFAEFLSSRI
jgi:hypothetical protein